MSAGVGVTPMTAVLASLAAQGSTRPLHWLHACRDGQHQVLRSAIDQAAAQLPQLQRSVWYETPQASDQQGKDYQHAGRMQLDGQLPAQPANAHYYLCGPAAFMRAQWQALLAHGVPMQQIQREVFGPELLEHLLG
jgi:nitric oxide dioxygenase